MAFAHSRQPPGRVRSVVGDYQVRSGPLDAGQGFEHGRSFVQPAVLGRGLDHGVFAADVVRGHGPVEFAFDQADDVQEGQGRLDHDDVRPLFHVQSGFAHGFAGIGRVHLVPAPVAEGRGRLGRFAEGPVKGRRVFGGVAHDGNPGMPGFVQSAADFRHPAVHHIRRGDHVGPGFHVAQGHAGQVFQSGVVVHLAVLEQPAVPVTGVFAQTDVGDDRQAGDLFLERPDGPLHHAFGFPARCFPLRPCGRVRRKGSPPARPGPALWPLLRPARSTEKWNWPARDEMGLATPWPGTTNRG